MRSTSGHYRKPIALESIIADRVTEAGYEKESEYVQGLIRYDLATRRQHLLTAGISGLPRMDQDKIDEEIARAYIAGESIGGSWFEHLVTRTVEDMAEKKDISPKEFAEAFLQRLREAANKPKDK